MTPATADGPVDLSVESEDAPENVDPRTDPRFSWRVATDRRGARQVAYRVVVGRDAERVVWGSDYPNVSDVATYGEAVHWLDRVDALSDRDRSWLRGRAFREHVGLD